MNSEFYSTVFKRKSFHLFRGVGTESIGEDELSGIREAFDSFERLYPEIQTAIRIVPAVKITLKRDAEYFILIYSEKKDNYLMNAGYLGEQLDLYLVKHDIGSLWYGVGKPDEAVFGGLDFVIMIAMHKVTNQSMYRKDMFRSKRKPLDEVWRGDTLGIAEVARFSPSACNSQPWYVENDGKKITVSRYKKRTRVGIMSPSAASYFNRIDMGIFLCILEICMAEKGIPLQRTMYNDIGDEDYTAVAEYAI